MPIATERTNLSFYRITYVPLAGEHTLGKQEIELGLPCITTMVLNCIMEVASEPATAKNARCVLPTQMAREHKFGNLVKIHKWVHSPPRLVLPARKNPFCKKKNAYAQKTLEVTMRLPTIPTRIPPPCKITTAWVGWGCCSDHLRETVFISVGEESPTIWLNDGKADNLPWNLSHLNENASLVRA